MAITDDRAGLAATPAADMAAGMAGALDAFRRAYPDFDGTAHLDELRATEYRRLDALGQTYLDYTGGGLYAMSQVREHQEMLADAVLGNPHSQNLPSREMTERIEATRARILEFFRASPAEYEVIFTPNATGALRLVGEAYPFGPGDTYLLTFDNHNSVNGIREFARARQADVCYMAVTTPELRVLDGPAAGQFSWDIETSQEPRCGTATPAGKAAPGGTRLVGGLAEGLRGARPGGHNLFSYPAQSNFSGVQHPLEWIGQAQAAGWDVLLDAAAFAPTNRLDLSRWHPDYVSLSFYKIFGYPTGIGALIARHQALAKLQRPWYAGGNLTFTSVQAAGAGGGYYRTPGAAGFEDGTVDYLGIPAIDIGLRHIAGIGMDTIHTRVMCLAGWLLNTLGGLRHSNGAPVAHIYGPRDTQMRGGTIALNFADPSGALIDSRVVERHANAAGIALRSGCHCNPGAGEVALGLTKAEMAAALQQKDQLSHEEFVQVIDGKKSGAARVSIGLASTFADVYRFVEFARGFRDVMLADLGSPPD
jgi:molybdenum cofactor sulfurtransferase